MSILQRSLKLLPVLAAAVMLLAIGAEMTSRFLSLRRAAAAAAMATVPDPTSTTDQASATNQPAATGQAPTTDQATDQATAPASTPASAASAPTDAPTPTPTGLSPAQTAAIARISPPQPAKTDAAARDGHYPFYMPMKGLRPPAEKFFVSCDASRAAGHEVYVGHDAASLYGRAQGGYEYTYEALDSAGQPCVYPFAPTLPAITGSVQNTQYILRSSIPGRRVIFRKPNDQWATVDLRIFDRGAQRFHFEMRDIELDFPDAVQPMGALHLESPDGNAPGLFTAVIRRSKIFGGKNGLFVPRGETMLYVEDSAFSGNIGAETDQQHTTYINGILVSHLVNSVWYGQHAGPDASGHQLKDKAYLRIYEDVTVSNLPKNTPPSAMPLLDISAFGFTWSNNLKILRLAPSQQPRDALVDLRTEIRYGAAGHYPWNVLVDPRWRMPAAPLSVLDKVYLSVFLNTTVQSFRNEPFIFRLWPQGTGFASGASDTTVVEGNDRTTLPQQRMVSLAFHTMGNAQRAYAPGGWTFANPKLPPDAQWVLDRDAFIRHALSLIGR